MVMPCIPFPLIVLLNASYVVVCVWRSVYACCVVAVAVCGVCLWAWCWATPLADTTSESLPLNSLHPVLGPALRYDAWEIRRMNVSVLICDVAVVVHAWSIIWFHCVDEFVSPLGALWMAQGKKASGYIHIHLFSQNGQFIQGSCWAAAFSLVYLLQ